MDRATDRIEQHLVDEHQALRSNLRELEDRVTSALDWRRQFRGNTAAFLALALGGGLLIGMVTARRAAAPSELEYPIPPLRAAAPHRDHRRRELSLAWRSIESALIGVVAAKLKDALAQMLPGFREHLDRGERRSYPRDTAARFRS
jgi:hypothetical protein